MFFKKDNINEKNDELIKVGALLIHAAKIDENYTEKEKSIIKKNSNRTWSKRRSIK